MTLSPSPAFSYRGETPSYEDGGVSYQTCDSPLPACDDPNLIDVSDIDAAIANPDVRAALVLTTTAWYGPRGLLPPSGNAPWMVDFRRSDPPGGFRVSDGACPSPSATCVPTPAGIQALVELLRALKQQQCPGVR